MDGRFQTLDGIGQRPQRFAASQRRTLSAMGIGIRSHGEQAMARLVVGAAGRGGTAAERRR